MLHKKGSKKGEKHFLCNIGDNADPRDQELIDRMDHKTHNSANGDNDAIYNTTVSTRAFKFRLDKFALTALCKNRSIYIWGAGEGGRNALSAFIKKGITVVGFIDSNPLLDGTRIESIPVHPPHALPRMYKEELIVIASAFWLEISESLQKMGYQYGESYIILGQDGSISGYQIDYTPESYVEKAIGGLNRFDHINDIKGTNILVLGSGIFPGWEIALLLSGAKFVVGMDIFDIPGFPGISPVIDFYEKYINCLMDTDIFRRMNPDVLNSRLKRLFNISEGKVCLNTNIYNFIKSRAEHLQLKPASFDFVISNAVMEHLENPLQSIKEISKVLKPQGYTLHQIDLRDHRSNEKPYDFLYMSKRKWRSTQQNLTFNAGNPHRAIEYKRWFEKGGFKVEQFKKQPVCIGSENCEEIDMNRVHKDYLKFSKEELSIQGCFIVAKKN